MHVPHALQQLGSKQQAVGAVVVLEAGHTEDDLGLLRVVAHSIAILYHCSKTQEDVMISYWNLEMDYDHAYSHFPSV